MTDLAGLTVGNVVQYVTETEVHAAIVTKVLDAETGRVHLSVFPADPDIVEIQREFQRVYSENATPGTWHWLPAVDGSESIINEVL